MSDVAARLERELDKYLRDEGPIRYQSPLRDHIPPVRVAVKALAEIRRLEQVMDVNLAAYIKEIRRLEQERNALLREQGRPRDIPENVRRTLACEQERDELRHVVKQMQEAVEDAQYVSNLSGKEYEQASARIHAALAAADEVLR